MFPSRHLLSVAAVVGAAALGGQVHAATALQVDVSVTIAANINVVWCASDGTGDVTTNQTWTLPTAAIATTYVTGTDGTAPTLRYLQNNATNCEIDVAATVANSYSWNRAAAVGTVNEFRMRTQVNAGGYSVLSGTGVQVINNLAVAAVTAGVIDLELVTPTTINKGAGLTQLITVTFTASADDGD